MIAELREDEPVRADPAAFDGVQHAERSKWEAFGLDGRGQRGKRSAYALGAFAKTTEPVLASLIGRRFRQSVLESLAVNKSSDEKRGNHGDAESQMRQSELRQQ